MVVGTIKPGIDYVGAIDWDRRLFDELIPLPDGTSYNSYIVKGSEKTVLIDTVDPTKKEDFINNLDELGVKKIDYIVAHHAEQDHSGEISTILEKYPGSQVVTNEKCKEFLIDLLQIPEDKFKIVTDTEELSLGDKTLRFMLTPWVHWPETMITYLPEDKILFSCDLFGSHLATSEIYAQDESKVYESAKRYYAEIMMPFRAAIKGHLKKIEDLDIEIIATSHGPIYDKPKFIIDAYKDWTSDNVKNEVIIPYVSMHGSTAKMVEHLTEALASKGLKVKPYNLTKTDIGDLAMELVDAATLIIASPTVLLGMHPSALYAAYLANALRPKIKNIGLIGSYGWGGMMADQAKKILTNLQADMLEPVIIKGHPKEEDYKALDKLALDVVEKHEKLGLVIGDG